ncbi:glycosyltransferase family 2 protein [Pseudonocardia kujensis]|uniref:glycosyltransferase family 2 protein n=1 Tax=Pseudonocardia kujensis TaxID=1128675 RepID=UPI001E48A63E|nr:glycosyltransferase family A protein [Pseudonocardia kujensis]MCE0761456.1 glycosyltransferase family 2 protein [Pseudonocardia kujensis]
MSPSLPASTPLVSVITPAYNVGPWIGEAVDSVLRQTEGRLEYVVIDDGSTDGTADIVRARAAFDSRIRLISTANAGSGAARNLGIVESSAPFVAFLDGDDRWHPEFLRRQLQVMQAVGSRVGATFCHTRVMLENGRVVGPRWQPAGVCDMDRFLAENNPAHNGSSLLVRRSCFDEVGVFDTGLASAVDQEMWLRIATRSSTPLFWGLRRYLIDMRLMRTGSISSNRGARYSALDKLLVEYAPLMSRLPSGLAYVQPAVFAYRDGFDDVADRWAGIALTAGPARLARTRWGQALLAWHGSGATGRARMRAARNGVRAGVYRGAARAAALLA